MKIWILNSITALYIGLTFVYVPNYALYLIPLAMLCYLLILVYAVSVIRLNFFFKSINQTKRNGVLLTFDDGPNTHTSEILDILKENEIKAVFFLIGSSIEGNEQVVQRIKNEGHTIGNHSFSHDNFLPMRSTKYLVNEIEKTNEILNNIGVKVKYFRPPFGVCNPRIARAIKKTKMQSVGWNLRSFDTKLKSKEELMAKLKSATNNSVILLHDSEQITKDVLNDFIKDAKNRGLKFAELAS